jgi:CRISPR/Cas system-associated endoribonuclease Cas2
MEKLLLLAIFLIPFFPVEAQKTETEAIEHCRENLTHIGQSLPIYFYNEKKYPLRLSALYKEGLISKREFSCPADHRFFDFETSSYEYEGELLQFLSQLDLLHSSFDFLRFLVIVSDKKDFHEIKRIASGQDWMPEGRNLLLWSGEVVYVSKQKAQEILMKQLFWFKEAQHQVQDSTFHKEALIESLRNLTHETQKQIEEETESIRYHQKRRKSYIDELKIKFLLVSMVLGLLVFGITFIRGRNKQNHYELKSSENVSVCILLLLIFGFILFYLVVIGESITPEEFFLIVITSFPSLGFSTGILTQQGFFSKFFGVVTTICYLTLILFVILDSFYSSVLQNI